MGLSEQIAGLQFQVRRIQERLFDATLSDPANSVRLTDAKARLVGICLKRRDELLELAAEAGPNSASSDLWSRLAVLRRCCAALAADCMALEQRTRGDSRISAAGRAADSLAEYFSSRTSAPRSHYAAISDAEHYGADSSSVHLSYARLDVWNLNRAVHEFGHLWAQEFASGPAGAQTAYIRTLGKPWNNAQAKELYADLIAAYLTGPAFGYSCLTLDFNPADRVGSDDHPSDEDRACSILAALDELAADVNPVTQQQFRDLTADLRSRWSADRDGAGVIGQPAGAGALKYAAEFGVAGMKAAIPCAQYRSLSLANQVKLAFDAAAAVRPEGAQGPDILNGAWLARRDRPEEESDFARKAMEMFAQLGV